MVSRFSDVPCSSGLQKMILEWQGSEHHASIISRIDEFASGSAKNAPKGAPRATPAAAKTAWSHWFVHGRSLFIWPAKNNTGWHGSDTKVHEIIRDMFINHACQDLAAFSFFGRSFFVCPLLVPHLRHVMCGEGLSTSAHVMWATGSQSQHTYSFATMHAT